MTKALQRKACWLGLIAATLLRVGFGFANSGDPLPECARDPGLAMDVEVLAVNARDKGPVIRVEVLGAACAQMVARKLRLSDYRADPFDYVKGDRLHVTVKLKQPWGARNPGGFNRRLWLLGQDVRATGYVLSLDVWQRGAPPALSGSKGLHPGVLRALALGDRSQVSESEWALFRATGTIHLMVVSGLHVGVLAGMVMLVVRGAARLLPIWGRRRFTRWLIPVGAGGVVFGFCWLTGFQAPVTRAGTTLILGMLLFATLRRGPWHHVLALAGCLLLLARPNLVFQSGFWLSFSAVALLIFVFAPRIRTMSYVTALIAVQLIMFIGMSPLTAYAVGPVPLVSPIANLAVVPVMSVCVIPAAMLGFAVQSILPVFSGWLLCLADQMLNVVIQLLALMRGWNLAALKPHDASSALILAIPIVLILLPLMRVDRAMMVAVWFFAMMRLPAPPDWGDFRVTVLDVGQGSAALIDTAHHRLILDAGPAFDGGHDAGMQVILPALRVTGYEQLDRLIISHEDLDHGGGAASVLEQFSNAEVVRQGDCIHGREWRWDGVSFKLLRHTSGQSRNARSCTVMVRSKDSTAYFPGDIDATSELALKKKLPRDIQFMTAPHHGSRTSSHPAFVKHLNPEVVVFSVGFGNRYGHPHATVRKRYVKRGATVLSTARDGAVVWSSRKGALRRYRTPLGRHHLPLISEVDKRVERLD
jgi:competence protein ComEC